MATGIWGGRFDHLYANIFSLLYHQKAKKDAAIILADHEEIMVLLGAGEKVTFVPTPKTYRNITFAFRERKQSINFWCKMAA